MNLCCFRRGIGFHNRGRWRTTLLAALSFAVVACSGEKGTQDAAKAAENPTATTQEWVFSVPSIHCSSCVGTIRGALRDVSGVESSQFDLEHKRVTVKTRGPAVERAAIEKAISDAGFPVEKSP